MTDPILYLSLLLGLGGVYVLISSFHDDDDGDDEEGEKYIYNLDQTFLAR
jgi:putative Mn2+ efflux pump MntP